MMSQKLNLKWTVVFKALAIGLASLMLILAGSGSAMLAHDPMSPPPGFTTVFVNGQTNDCAKGTPIQGAKVIVFSKYNKDLKVETATDSEGQFSVLAILFGPDAQGAVADLSVDFPGFAIGSLTSEVITRPFLGTFISITACLAPAPPDLSIVDDLRVIQNDFGLWTVLYRVSNVGEVLTLATAVAVARVDAAALPDIGDPPPHPAMIPPLAPGATSPAGAASHYSFQVHSGQPGMGLRPSPWSVTLSVDPVPGEVNIANNTVILSLPIPKPLPKPCGAVGAWVRFHVQGGLPFNGAHAGMFSATGLPVDARPGTWVTAVTSTDANVLVRTANVIIGAPAFPVPPPAGNRYGGFEYQCIGGFPVGSVTITYSYLDDVGIYRAGVIRLSPRP